MQTLARILFFTAVLLLSGCAAYRVAEMPAGASTEQVAARAGKPTDTWKESGGEAWEYATGPKGFVTYIARFDGGGKLLAVNQVLDEPFFEKIRPGASREDVRRTLGRPGGIQKYDRRGEELWTWRYLEDTRRMYFNVHFDEAKGVVRETTKSIDYSDQRSPGNWLFGG